MVRFPVGERDLCHLKFSRAPKHAVGPSSLLFSAYRSFSPGVMLPGREADKPLPFAADVKNEWRYMSTFIYAFMNASGADKAAADPIVSGGLQIVLSIKLCYGLSWVVFRSFDKRQFSGSLLSGL